MFKACPKCRGDLCVDHDLQDRTLDLVCIQCGYRLPSNERERLLMRAHGLGAADVVQSAGRQRTAA